MLKKNLKTNPLMLVASNHSILSKKEIQEQKDLLMLYTYERIFLELEKIVLGYSNIYLTPKDIRIKAIVAGIQWFSRKNTLERSKFYIERNHFSDNEIMQKISFLIELIGTISPEEIAVLFPARKVYNGKKSDSRDYFDSMQAVNDASGYCRFAKEKDDVVTTFLMDYDNFRIRCFSIFMMRVINKMQRIRGEETFVKYIDNLAYDKESEKITENKKEIKKIKVNEKPKLKVIIGGKK